jgi:hypothetical protein
MEDRDMRKMMPIGSLMIEHRLIERMIALMRQELDRITTDNTVDSVPPAYPP